MSVKILLADDHHIVRQGLKALLRSEPEFEVVAEAGNGLEAIQMVERFHPDVAVVDLMMPGVTGLEVTRQIHAETRVIILSMHANEAYVLEALRVGASGYVLKDSTASDLVEAIHAVIEGRRYLSPLLSERAIAAYMQKTEASPVNPYETLTPREREVFQLVVQGLSNNEISAKLSLSPRTVEIHRGNMMRKLDLHNQVDLIRFAIKKGILTLDD